MDNFCIHVICKGDEALKHAFNLAFSKHKNAAFYAIRPAETAVNNADVAQSNRPTKSLRLIFFWCKQEGVKDLVPFPFKMDAAACAEFASRWLAEADYGPEPDHDGSNGRGWRLYNESWGHIDEEYSAIIAVAPNWAWFGK